MGVYLISYLRLYEVVTMLTKGDIRRTETSPERVVLCVWGGVEFGKRMKKVWISVSCQRAPGFVDTTRSWG